MQEFNDTLAEFREHMSTHKPALIFVVIMSHGGSPERPDSIYTDDLQDVDAWNDVIYQLGEHKKLRDVPKIILFNMCRDSWKPWNSDRSEKDKQDTETDRCDHSLRHTLLLFTTLPYDYSLRNEVNGAVYITEMKEVFEKQAYEKNLRRMLYDVSSIHSCPQC